jgi:DivIVA domain-containing protein
MAIHSSTVADHRFTVTRWGGYVVAEVDAVMARLAATLRQYEENAEHLLARVEAAEASYGALEKDRLDLLRAGDDLVAFAEEESERIVAEARRRADREMSRREQQIEKMLAVGMQRANAIAAEGRRAQDEASADAERIRTEAEEILERARDYGLTMRRQAADEAARFVRAALSEVQKLRAGARDEVAATRAKVETELFRTVAAAREEADSVVKEAHIERIALNQRIAELHATIGDIEDELHDPSTTALVLRPAATPRGASSTLASGGASRISNRLGPALAGVPREAITIHLEEEDKPSGVAGPTELAAAVRQILYGETDRHGRPAAPLDTTTWYQRHGGGIRRRMEEQSEEATE